MRREPNDPRGPRDDDRARTEMETLAALAAVEGLGVAAFGSETPDGVEMDSERVAEFELAAGALFSALAPRDAAEAPVDLVDRLLATTATRGFGDAPFNRRASQAGLGRHQRSASSPLRPSAALAPADDPVPVASPPFGRPPRGLTGQRLALVGGWAAAALLAVYVAVSNSPSDAAMGDAATNVEVPTLDAQDPARVRILADAFGQREDTVHSAWSVGDLEGEVLWNDAENAGFMYIDGLPENDPEVSQYQLWIFRGNDPGAEPHPVDGGVFDVTSNGAVVVPIDAKLNVGSAGLFAVTVEKPGGVVVSERESIVAVAVRS